MHSSKKPTRERFQEWADAGMSAKNICEMLKVSPGTVSRWGQEYNIALNRAGWGGNRKQNYARKEEADAVVLFRLPIPATDGRLSYWARVE